MIYRGGRTVLCGLLFCLTIISAANSAYAADTDINSCENWFNQKDYETVQIQSDNLSGCLRFFYAQNCLYCCLSYTEPNITGTEKIAVEINISNINRDYTVYFTATDDKEYPCKLTKCFSELTKTGQDIYFMLEFTEKEDKSTQNHAQIKLKINDITHYITLIDIQSPEEEAEYTLTTQKGNEKRAKAEETTKFVYSQDEDHEKAETQNNTKFSSNYGGDVQNEAVQEYSYDSADEDMQESVNGQLLNVPVEKETSFSPQAKAMLGLSGAFAFSGTAVLIRSAVKQRAAKKNDVCESNINENISDSNE